METVQAYRAKDGALFGSTDECREHEVSLVWREKIDAFQKTDGCPYQSGAHAGMVRKIVIAWEDYKIRSTEGIS